MKIFLWLSSIGLAVAGDISLQTFVDDDCGGGTGAAIQNVHASGKDTTDGSGCQAQGQFHSVNVVSADPGFQCNIYGDSACQNFLQGVTTPVCTPVIGQGVICFNNAAFSNPFIESTARVALGNQQVMIYSEPPPNQRLLPGLPSTGQDGNQQSQIENLVSQACTSGSACDPTSKISLSRTFQSGNVGFCSNGGDLSQDKSQCDPVVCTTSISISGNFNDNNQRDYMKDLMTTALDKAQVPAAPTNINDNELTILMGLSFVGVQIIDKNKAIQAFLSVTTTSECSAVSPEAGFQCPQTLVDSVGAGLGAVPVVGGIGVLLFQVACDTFGSG